MWWSAIWQITRPKPTTGLSVFDSSARSGVTSPQASVLRGMGEAQATMSMPGSCAAVSQSLAAISSVEGMPTSSGFFGAMPSCIMGSSAALVASVKSGMTAPSASA